MTLDLAHYMLGALSGSLVGLTLGLFGGGGSILAVPLMVYLVGVTDAHIAIGTSAVAVGANAATNLVTHARHGNVRWRCALIYSAAGIVGAYAGTLVGKAVDGSHLLFLFALLMLGIGIAMILTPNRQERVSATCTLENAPRTLGFGAGTGALAGFFGIGGGFLIVPGLVAATGMPMLAAIGSSLVAVTAFGLTTALSYATSAFVDWPLAAVFIAGGAAGGAIGALAAGQIAGRRGALNSTFAALIIGVALFMGVRSWMAI